MSKKYFTTTFARIFLSLSLGILVAEYTAISANVFLGILVAGLSLSIISILRANRLGGWIFVLSWSLFLFGVGGWLLRQTAMPAIPEGNHSYVVELRTTPIDRGTYYRTEAEIIYSADSATNHLVGQNILLNIYADSLLRTPQICDRYLIHSRISRPSDNGIEGFDYGKYLARHGLCGVAYISADNLQYLSTQQPSSLMQYSYIFRNKLIARFQSLGFKGAQLAIISAITLGEKGFLSGDVKDTFSAAGVSHILVVSGMHVGFIFLLIGWLQQRISRRRRWIITIFGLFLLWSYAMLTGLAPSVVRATFMFSMILLFSLFKEKYRVEHALCFSATILLLCNPNTLFDVGFQLSYLAVIGISYFYRLVSKRIMSVESKVLRWTLQSCAVTISAQIFTLPIVIYQFNQFPAYFIISNLFVTLFAPVLFLGGIALLPLSFIPYLGNVAGWLMSHIVELFEWIISLIVSLPFSTTQIYLSLTESLLLYLIIFCAINWIEVRKHFAERFRAPLYFGLSVCLFVAIISINNVYYSKQQVLIIPETNRLVVNIFNSDQNTLFTNNSDFATERLNRTWLKFSCAEPTIVTDTTLIANTFTFADESYLILRDNIFRYQQNNGAPLVIDNLIIDRGIYPSERLFTEFIHPRRVILTASVWQGYIEKYKALFIAHNIPYHIISEQGALTLIE